MVNPKLMEAWFNLMVEATKGTKDAQEAFRSLSKISDSPEEMSRWLAQFMPAAMASGVPAQPEAFEEWLEESWRMMGVVPRSRYLDLLEKYDILQRKLEKAEETIQRLRASLDNTDEQAADTQKVMDMWGGILEDTLKAQTELMQAWNAANTQAVTSSPEEQGGASDTDGA